MYSKVSLKNAFTGGTATFKRFFRHIYKLWEQKIFPDFPPKVSIYAYSCRLDLRAGKTMQKVCTLCIVWNGAVITTMILSLRS